MQDIKAHDVYRATVAVMMRIVFLPGFLDGAAAWLAWVFAIQTGTNALQSAITLTRRNTRRYDFNGTRARITTPCGVWCASISSRPACCPHRLKVLRVAGLS